MRDEPEVSLASLERAILQLTDRTPATPTRLKMSRRTADRLCELAAAKTVNPDGGTISGVRIEYDDTIPDDQWKEWFNGAWRDPNPLNL